MRITITLLLLAFVGIAAGFTSDSAVVTPTVTIPAMPASANPSQRFSDRVDDYVRHRPTYPTAVLDFLANTVGFDKSWRVADVGSGTGISSKLFLDHGNRVIGVEPNANMRAAAEQFLARHSAFRSVAGAAEATTLPDASVDLVVASQAFHWFDLAQTRDEFRRILRPTGWVALVWNTRKLTGSPFLEAYERLLVTHGTDYLKVRHEAVTLDRIHAFFGTSTIHTTSLPNHQRLDRAGLLGRLGSASYFPASGTPVYEEAVAEANQVFDLHAQDGHVVIEYSTDIFVGQFV